MKKKNHPLDVYAVAYRDENNEEQWLQTEPTEEKAMRALAVVNGHETDNGRPAKFYVIQIEL